MRKISLEDRTSNSDDARAETWCKGHCCWLSSANAMLEAQLSQRDRATLSVIDYFANSLKVTQESR